MKYTILMGSPRREGNTAALLKPFFDENQAMGIEQEVLYLHDLDLLACKGCKICQDRHGEFGCVQEDDMSLVFRSVMTSDVLVFATPIYSWYCTPSMKAAMDRLIYAGCKYYGQKRERSLYWMKQVAGITTCGYPAQKGADLWEEGLKRWCHHGEMDYLGMLTLQDSGDPAEFVSDETDFQVRDFAHALYIMVNHSL